MTEETETPKVAHRAVGKVTAAARSVGVFLWRRKIGIAIGVAIALIPLPFPRTWATKLNMIPK